MATERLRAGRADRFWKTIGHDVAKASRGASPVELALEASDANIDEDELVLLVVSRNKAFFQRRRVRATAKTGREVLLRVAAMEAALERIVGAPSRPAPQLSSSEASLLDAGGLPEEEADEPSALERAAIELEAMREHSLTLEEAARALGVSPARLRQRLAPGNRTLLGLKDGRSWRIPRFQFTGGTKRLVPGLARVLPKVRADAHPVAVARWFATPHQDLVIGDDEKRATPLRWLSAGNDPDVVADLAGEI